MFEMKGQGFEEVAKRFRDMQVKVDNVMKDSMEKALREIQKLIPAYPKKPPKSKYVRTGNLGRGMGSGFGGGAVGTPSVFKVTMGSGYVKGEIGSNRPHYTQYVIGENQAGHMTHWWNVKNLRDIAENSVDVWRALTSGIVKILTGKA